MSGEVAAHAPANRSWLAYTGLISGTWASGRRLGPDSTNRKNLAYEMLLS
jgi:hypothetical protein